MMHQVRDDHARVFETCVAQRTRMKKRAMVIVGPSGVHCSVRSIGCGWYDGQARVVDPSEDLASWSSSRRVWTDLCSPELLAD